MDINQIWAVVEPYVMAVVGALGGGTVIYALARVLLGRLLNKFSAKYDVADMANKVADKLAGKSMNIDVTTVTEKKLDKIDKKLRKEVEKIHDETAAYKHLLALIGGAMAKLKALTPEERNALSEAITALEHDYIPPEPEEILTVKLEPIATADETPADLPNERFL